MDNLIDNNTGNLNIHGNLFYHKMGINEAQNCLENYKHELSNYKNGYKWILLKEVEIHDSFFHIGLCFKNNHLDYIDFRFSSPDELKKTWSDWSEAHERNKTNIYEKWLTKNLGKERKFNWGKIETYHDPKGGTSGILIKYEEHMNPQEQNLQTLISDIIKASQAEGTMEIVYKSEWLGFLPFGISHRLNVGDCEIQPTNPDSLAADLEQLCNIGILKKVKEIRLNDEDTHVYFRICEPVETHELVSAYNPFTDYSQLDLSNEDNMVCWKFGELIKTLITLSKDAEKQVEWIGYGAVADEMATDFETYYSIEFQSYLDANLLTSDQKQALDELDQYLTDRSDYDPDFWNDSILDKNPDWEWVRSKARQILNLLNLDHVSIKVDRYEEFDDNGKLVIQTTKLKLVPKNGSAD